MSKASRDETPGRPFPEPLPQVHASRSGRPRQWANAAEKHRAYRERQAECQRLLADLLAAVRDASLEGEELRKAAVDGNNAELLRALIAHYRERHWCRARKEDAR